MHKPAFLFVIQCDTGKFAQADSIDKKHNNSIDLPFFDLPIIIEFVQCTCEVED